MTTIIELQRHDHAEMDQLIQRYQQADVSRPDIFRTFVDLVTTHAFAEETILFPAARRLLEGDGESLTAAIESEHQEANELLKEMEQWEPSAPDFEARAERLFAILRHDARQEEDVLLVALADASPSELDSIGTAWLMAKRAAPNRAHPMVSRRPPWNVVTAPVLTVLDHLRSVFARLQHRSQ